MIDPRGEADGFISDYWLTDEQRVWWETVKRNPSTQASTQQTKTMTAAVLECDRAAIIMRHLLRLLAERDGFPTEVDE